MNGFAVLGAYFRGALVTLAAIFRGSRAAIAIIAVMLLAFATLPQASELALARLESPLALARMVGASVWLALTLWHCCDAKICSRSASTACGPCPAFRRMLPTALAAGFLGAMTLIEIRALNAAASLPTEPIRLYPILEMQTLGTVILPIVFLSRIDLSRWSPQLLRAGRGLVQGLRSRKLFGFVNLALFLWAATLPIHFAWTVGTEGTLLIAASCWLTALTYVQIYWRRNWGIPLTSAVVVLTIVSCTIDSHSIRCTDCNAIFPAAEGEASPGNLGGTVSGEGDRAAALRGPAPLVNKLYAYEYLQLIDETRPLVLVSAAGGGIRAAYWTATVLGDLQDHLPLFDRHIFAISGVSGGSLGAGVYRALVQHARLGRAVECRSSTGEIVSGYRRCGQVILERDFTGPLLAALLFRDVLPVPGLLDRAAVLEQAWEASWQRSVLEPGEGLARRFDQVDAVSRFPVLVLNGVSALTGERVVAAGLGFNPNLLNIATIRPLPLSAAIGTSTRFPFMEPAGSIYDRTGRFYNAVVDGGYVENFGSNSALEILREIGYMIQDDRQPVPSGKRQFIRTTVFIQISSDPTLDDGTNLLFNNGLISLSTFPAGVRPPDKSVINLDQTWLPLAALLGARTTQSTFTANLVSTYVRTLNGVFTHFRLADRYAHAPALGWTLSKRSELQIDGERAQTENAILKRLEPYFVVPKPPKAAPK